MASPRFDLQLLENVQYPWEPADRSGIFNNSAAWSLFFKVLFPGRGFFEFLPRQFEVSTCGEHRQQDQGDGAEGHRRENLLGIGD